MSQSLDDQKQDASLPPTVQTGPVSVRAILTAWSHADESPVEYGEIDRLIAAAVRGLRRTA